MEKQQVRSIDRQAWLEALHVKGGADPLLKGQMDKAEDLLLKGAEPKYVYRIMERDSVKVQGFSIEKHLEDCHKVIIMAVTLGGEVDTLIRRTQITDMALAVIIDTGASLMAEQLADDCETYIKNHIRESTDKNIYFTSRFSPGYGDYPLNEQTRILRYVEARKNTGINVTADSLMVPRKSITALMGISDRPVDGRPASCGECVLKDKCTLKKEGRFCGDKL